MKCVFFHSLMNKGKTQNVSMFLLALLSSILFRYIKNCVYFLSLNVVCFNYFQFTEVVYWVRDQLCIDGEPVYDRCKGIVYLYIAKFLFTKYQQFLSTLPVRNSLFVHIQVSVHKISTIFKVLCRYVSVVICSKHLMLS